MNSGKENAQVLVSVTVPVYNVAKYLPQCIESICNQTYEALEIILVDDGSTDESGSICDRYAQEDARITVIHKKNGGLVSARKAGLAIAHGEYVSCVDSDDWVELDMIKRLMDMESATNADMIAFAGYEECNGYRGTKENTVMEGLYQTKKQLEEIYARMLMNGNFFEPGISTYIWNKFFKRSLLEKYQMKVSDAISYGEDTACVYPCILAAGSVCVTNLHLYHYRVRQDSIVRNGLVSDESIRHLFQTLKENFESHIQRNVLHKQLEYYMWHTFLLKRYDRIKSDLLLYPFEKVKAGMKIVIYGAGMFGQVIEQYCRQREDVVVVGWFDKRYEEYAGQGLDVKSGENVTATDFDVMVIAILNTALAQKIKENYIRDGIAADKIDVVDRKILNQYKLPIGD